MAELSRRVLRLGIVILALGLFGCDHATKLAATAALAGGRAIPVYDGLVELRYTENDDTAFSLLHNLGVPRNATVLVVLACFAFLGIVATWFAARKRLSMLQHAGFAIVLAGALGNVVDRALRGYVVDFIRVWRWPVFNVADVLVVVGAMLFIVAGARAKKKPPDQASAAP